MSSQTPSSLGRACLAHQGAAEDAASQRSRCGPAAAVPREQRRASALPAFSPAGSSRRQCRRPGRHAAAGRDMPPRVDDLRALCRSREPCAERSREPERLSGGEHLESHAQDQALRRRADRNPARAGPLLELTPRCLRQAARCGRRMVARQPRLLVLPAARAAAPEQNLQRRWPAKNKEKRRLRAVPASTPRASCWGDEHAFFGLLQQRGPANTNVEGSSRPARRRARPVAPEVLLQAITPRRIHDDLKIDLDLQKLGTLLRAQSQLAAAVGPRVELKEGPKCVLELYILYYCT